MNVRDLSRRAGIAAALVSVLLLAVPFALVSGFDAQLVGYYAAGPVGAGAVALFALLSAVVFASVEQGNVDPGALAGALVVLGVATVLLAAVWVVSIEPTTMFGEHRWLRWHAPAVAATALLLPVCAGVYARELLA